MAAQKNDEGKVLSDYFLLLLLLRSTSVVDSRRNGWRIPFFVFFSAYGSHIFVLAWNDVLWRWYYYTIPLRERDHQTKVISPTQLLLTKTSAIPGKNLDSLSRRPLDHIVSGCCYMGRRPSNLKWNGHHSSRRQIAWTRWAALQKSLLSPTPKKGKPCLSCCLSKWARNKINPNSTGGSFQKRPHVKKRKRERIHKEP